jgi:hyperosmotically inducible protein
MSRIQPALMPLAVGLVAGALLVGCEKTSTTTSTPAGTATTTTVSPSPGATAAMGTASSAATSAMNSASSAMSNAGTALSDTALTAKVKTALLADDNVKGLRIDVETNNGVVVLVGTADTPANQERASVVARGVEGVKSVDNRLTVKP